MRRTTMLGGWVLCGWVAFLSCVADGQERVFDSWSDLCEAVPQARAGETLVLRSGAYRIDDAVTFAAGQGGSEGAPVTVRAESVSGCKLTGDSTAFAFKPGAGHVEISGFEFHLRDETAVKLSGANHVRVTRCTFRLLETDSFDWLVITGAESSHNRVDHCRFEGKRQPGNYVTIDGDSKGQQSQYDRIDHNQFLDIGPRAKNEKEAVRIGWSKLSMSSGYTILEHNYFERCDGDPEIVSVKSCDNIVRNNKVVDCMGVISLRHGDRNVVRGNVILGRGRDDCGGIRVYGDDHKITGNYLEGLTGKQFSAALALTNGDADNAAAGKNLSKHFRPRRIEIRDNAFVNNASSIELGYARSSKKPWRKAPQDLVFESNLITSNVGLLVTTHTPAEGVVWKANRLCPTGQAKLGIDAGMVTNQLAEQIDEAAIALRKRSAELNAAAPQSASEVGPLAP